MGVDHAYDVHLRSVRCRQLNLWCLDVAEVDSSGAEAGCGDDRHLYSAVCDRALDALLDESGRVNTTTMQGWLP